MPVEKVPMVCKSNVMNEGSFAGLGVTAYRVLLNCITHIQRYDGDGNLLALDLASRNCSVSAYEYAKHFKITTDMAYVALKIAVDRLMKKSFELLRPNGGVLKINICSQAEYRPHEGKIDIEFTPNIMPHLAALGDKYTMYALEELYGLNSEFSIRFYEFIQQWKTLGEKKINTADLRHILGCNKKFKQYNDFKRFAFKHAIDEINALYNINITFTEIKTGRAVTELLFRFRAIHLSQAYDLIKQKMRTQVGKYTRKKAIKPVNAGKNHEQKPDLVSTRILQEKP